jgi:hypothetical protein
LTFAISLSLSRHRTRRLAALVLSKPNVHSLSELHPLHFSFLLFQVFLSINPACLTHQTTTTNLVVTLGQIHWEAVKDVIRYLKGTADLTLMLGGSVNGLEAYVDADWASQPHRHSMLGYTVLLHSSPVAWSIWKQSIIALSTAEAEYIALTAVVHEILYLQALIVELYECHESDVPPFLFPYLHNQLRPTCLRTHSQTSVPFKIPFVFRTKRHLGPDGFVLT